MGPQGGLFSNFNFMKLPKSLVVLLAMTAACLLSSCSVQKRTTAPGWHVEKASGWFRQAGPSSSLAPQVKPDLPTLTRMKRLPPRALDWTTSTLPTDTSAVDAKVKRQVTSALRREIRVREELLMFPRLPPSVSELKKADAEKWHNRAEQICKEQGQFLSEVAPDEFARLESLRYPSRDTMKELKQRKKRRVVAGSTFVLVFTVLLLFLLAIATHNPWG